MSLIIKNYWIKNIVFSEDKESEGIREGCLSIYPQGLIDYLKEDERVHSCKLEIALPGDSVRILPVKDVIEPRAKEEGELFPGVDGPIVEAGEGVTLCLKDCAIVTTGSIVGFQEGIIDMKGPLTKYTPFSKLNNLVVVLEKKAHIDPHDHEAMIRLAGIKAAQYVGKLARGVQEDEQIEMIWEKATKRNPDKAKLPKVVYVYQCIAQGLLHDTYFYGKNAQSLFPTLVSPLEIMDGAITSGNCVSAGSKNTTYHHQNNAVLKELLGHDGKNIDLVGIILSPMSTMLDDKYRNSLQSVKMASYLGAEGAIVSQEGFGNPTTDLMMICRGLENKGIKTVILSNEDAGVDGYSESLPDGTSKADAIISTGNSNATIHIPPMDRVIGDLKAIERVTGGFVGSIHEDGSLTIEVHGIMGGHNLLGDTYLSAIDK